MNKEVKLTCEVPISELKEANGYRYDTVVALGRAFVNFRILAGESEITDLYLLRCLGKYFIHIVRASMADQPLNQIIVPPELIEMFCHAKWQPTIEFRILQYANGHGTYIDEFIKYMRDYGYDMVINHLPEIFSRAIREINSAEVGEISDVSDAIKRLNTVDAELRIRELLAKVKSYRRSLDVFCDKTKKFINAEKSNLYSALYSYCCSPEGMIKEEVAELTKDMDEFITLALSAFEQFNHELGDFSRDLQTAITTLSQLTLPQAIRNRLQKYLNDIPSYTRQNDNLSKQLRDIQNKMALLSSEITTQVLEEQSAILRDAKRSIAENTERYQSLAGRHSILMCRVNDVTEILDYLPWKSQILYVLDKLHLDNPGERREMLNDVLKKCRTFLIQFMPIEHDYSDMMKQLELHKAANHQLKQHLGDIYAKTSSPQIALLIQFLEIEIKKHEMDNFSFHSGMREIRQMIIFVDEINRRVKKECQALNALASSNGSHSLFESPPKAQPVKTKQIDDNVRDENVSTNALHK